MITIERSYIDNNLYSSIYSNAEKNKKNLEILDSNVYEGLIYLEKVIIKKSLVFQNVILEHSILENCVVYPNIVLQNKCFKDCIIFSSYISLKVYAYLCYYSGPKSFEICYNGGYYSLKEFGISYPNIFKHLISKMLTNYNQMMDYGHNKAVVTGLPFNGDIFTPRKTRNMSYVA